LLYNYSMRFLRYKIYDKVVEKIEEKCGEKNIISTIILRVT